MTTWAGPVVRTARERAVSWLGGLALALLSVIWLGSLAGSSLLSPDEGRYASLSLGMLQSGDWVTPRLNGLLYFEKPPLQYWTGAFSMALFGANEFAARLWPGLSGLATVLLLGYTARRLWGTEAGWRAGFIAGATTWIVVNSHFLSLDAGLTAALTLVLCALLIAEHARAASPLSAGRWVLAAWVGIGLAILSKGLVGIVIPGAVLVVHSVWRRDISIWRHLRWVPGLATAAAISMPWFVLVSTRNPDFASFFFIHEHLQRFLTPVHRREGSWWYFLPFLLIGLMPWTSALPWLLRVDRTDFATSLLMVWAAFIFLFFSVSSSKLPSYILPMFPALVLLVARSIDGVSVPALRRHLWAPTILWAVALLCVPFASSFVSANTPQPAVTALAAGMCIAATIFLGSMPVALWLLGKGRLTPALGVVAGAHLVAILVLLVSHNTYGQLKSSDPLIRVLRPQIDATTPVFAVRRYDQTLPFYLGRSVILADYVDEFEFGERHEPQRWVSTLDQFVIRWNAERHAAAYMDHATLNELRERGLEMRVVFDDPRRLVVVKP